MVILIDSLVLLTNIFLLLPPFDNYNCPSNIIIHVTAFTTNDVNNTNIINIRQWDFIDYF